MVMATLKEKYDAVCNDYISAFKEKQGFVNVEIDTAADAFVYCDQYSISFSEIKTDIDNNIKKGLIIEFQEYAIDNFHEKNLISYANWLRIVKRIKL